MYHWATQLQRDKLQCLYNHVDNGGVIGKDRPKG